MSILSSVKDKLYDADIGDSLSSRWRLRVVEHDENVTVLELKIVGSEAKIVVREEHHNLFDEVRLPDKEIVENLSEQIIKNLETVESQVERWAPVFGWVKEDFK